MHGENGEYPSGGHHNHDTAAARVTQALFGHGEAAHIVPYARLAEGIIGPEDVAPDPVESSPPPQRPTLPRVVTASRKHKTPPSRSRSRVIPTQSWQRNNRGSR